MESEALSEPECQTVTRIGQECFHEAPKIRDVKLTYSKDAALNAGLN